MSIEAVMERLAIAVEQNNVVVEKLIAGRDAALEQLKTAAEAPKTTRSRKKADEPAAVVETPAAETPVAETPAATAVTAEVTDDQLRDTAQKYIGGAGEDATARQARGANLKAMLDHFGVAKLVGPEGLQDPEQKQQALFYLKRYDASIAVDFSADYDFAGDPAQGGAEPAAASGDEFDIG